MPRTWFIFDKFFPAESWWIYFDGACRQRVGMGLDEVRLPENSPLVGLCIDLIVFAEMLEEGKGIYSPLGII